MNTFHAETVSGNTVILYALSITLPRVYFFDRGEFIEAAIRPSDDWTSIIDVAVLRTAADEKDGLNEFLSAMLPGSSGSDLTPNLRSMPLRTIQYSFSVSQPLPLVTKISMRELAARLPREKQALMDLKIHGKRPYAAFVSPHLDWTAVLDLENLQKARGFSWQVQQGTASD